MSELRLFVRYAETDAMRVAHHSAYVVWMEAARVGWLKDRGLSYKKLEGEGINLAVSKLNLDYRSSATFDDEIVITTTLSELRNRRVSFDYEICRADGALIARGSSTHTPTNAQGRAIRLPADWLKKLQAIR